MVSARQINSLVAVSLVFICACARVSSPGGGLADEKPPVVLKSIPENRSTGFKERSFEILFNEYFVLDNVDEVLMISPPMNKKPEFKVRGKSLLVELDEEEKLVDNITYSFNFLNSIKDLNEGNPLENYKYVFSTGDIIDSLSVTGYIYNAFDLEAGEDILVILYAEKSDTMPLTSLPDYITRAASNGRFRIDNIAGGEYRIYGLKDENRNKMFDLPDESFAFIDSVIFVSPSNNYIPERPDSLLFPADSTLILTDSDSLSYPVIDEEQRRADSIKYERMPGREYMLYYFVGENKTQYLTGSKRTMPYLLEFTFALPVDTGSFDLQFADTEDEVGYIRENTVQNDTFRIWLTDSTFYSREMITIYLGHPETDTTGALQTVRDTVRLRYVTDTRGRRRSAVKTDNLAFNTNLSQSGGLSPGENPVFIFDTPVLKPDTSLISLFMVYDSLKISLDYTLLRDSLNTGKFVLETELLSDSSYMLVAEKGAFRNIYNSINDSVVYNFRLKDADQFGKLILNLSGFSGDIIIQLMDSNEKIIREGKISMPEQNRLEFTYLPEKEYMLKAIFDINRDGKWTTGDYKLQRQPEPVTYYPKKIQVKKGWEMIEDWAVSVLREKEAVISKTRAAKTKK